MERSPDVIIVGAGLIGLAIARELHGRGLRPLILEQGSAGHGASWAGAGMLAARQTDLASPLRALALASADLYPDFVRDLESETGARVDYRPAASLLVGRDGRWREVADHCVDNRRLVSALAEAVRRRGVPLVEHSAATAVVAAAGGWRVATAAGHEHRAPHVVVAAGAWSAALLPSLAVRPRKGQMLALAAPAGLVPRVIVGSDVYLVPRADGRVVVGATVEDVGFDLAVEPVVIGRLQAAAVALVPALAACPVVETWAGLRPGSHDDLPYLGAMPGPPGLWAATGHFRDGILLTPITAEVMADLMTGRAPRLDLTAFSPARYQPPLP